MVTARQTQYLGVAEGTDVFRVYYRCHIDVFRVYYQHLGVAEDTRLDRRVFWGLLPIPYAMLGAQLCALHAV